MQKYTSVSSGSAFARLRMLAYYAQRILTNRLLRYVAAHFTIVFLRILHRRARPKERRKSASTKIMRETGYLRLNQLLSAQQIVEIHNFLKTKQVVAARGSGQSFTLDEIPAGTSTGDYPLETVVNCPHVLELANNPEVLALAASYLGYTPTITLMGIRWSFPGDSVDLDIQGFHRDLEMGSIKLLVYLTDVDIKSGPHSYVQGTHLDRLPLRLRRYSDEDVMREHGGSVIITGSAGTAFAIDIKGIHKGTPPASRARLILTIQYSLLPCLNYDYEPVNYFGKSPVNEYINRLMIQKKSTIGSEEMPMNLEVHDLTHDRVHPLK